MTKKELIEILEDFNEDDDVIVFWYHDGHPTLDSIISACKNGNSLQLNTESILEDPK